MWIHTEPWGLCAVGSPSARVDCSVLQVNPKEETSKSMVRESLGGAACGQHGLCDCCEKRWHKAARVRWAQHGLCPLPGSCHPLSLGLPVNTSSAAQGCRNGGQGCFNA